MQPLMRMSRAKLATVAVVSLVISGCAIDKEGCDPAALRTAGFFTKVSCDVSGSYQARADDQQAQLEEATRQRDLLQNSVNLLEDENRRLSEGITLKRAQRDRLTASLNATLAAIAQGNEQNKTVMDQIDKAKLEIDRLSNLPENTNPAVLQNRIQAVQDEMDDLLKLQSR